MRRTKGLTLIELLTLIVMVGIFLTIGVPGFTKLLAQNEAEAQLKKLRTAIQHARQLAVTQQIIIKMCGSNDGYNCSRNNYKQLITFQDSNGNSVVDDGEAIHLMNVLSSRGQIVTKVSLGLPYFQFNPDGSSRQIGSLVYCPADLQPDLIRQITWNRAGRPYAVQRNDQTICQV